MIWLAVLSVAVVVLTVYACLVAGSRADDEMEHRR